MFIMNTIGKTMNEILSSQTQQHFKSMRHHNQGDLSWEQKVHWIQELASATCHVNKLKKNIHHLNNISKWKKKKIHTHTHTLDKTQHPFLAKVKDRTAWSFPVSWRASTKPSNLLTACLTVRCCTSPQASSRAVCSQDTGGSSQCNQARQRKGVQVREEATLSLLTDGNPEGSIKRLLEGVARCKINIQKSIVRATYNQEMNFF